MTIFFTSDTHFHHVSILKYCNRPFASVEEMNEKLIANWNSVVTSKDVVYHMGDFSWGNAEKIRSVFDRLNGQKHLVLGNHDDIDSHKKLKWNWVKTEYTLKVNDLRYVLYHYPQRSWNYSVHGARHLFGHCHGTAKPWGYSFDVGTDCWDFTPVSIEVVEATIAKMQRMNPEYDVAFMPKGVIWNGKTHDYSYRDFFVGDGSLDKVDPDAIRGE